MSENLPRLYLNMIVKDDENPDMVKRAIDSVKKYVDGMYITVTHKKKKPKKSSKLVKMLEKQGANISFFKWVYNFAKARQFALDQVPRGRNVFVYWHDADDILKGAENLPMVVQDMVERNIAAVYFTYWYQVDLDESGEVREVLVEHKRERVIRNDDTWQWVGPLHETLIEQRQENMIRISRDECVVVHLTNHQRLDHNIDRNIQILEEALREDNHKDPRNRIYLAKAYLDKGKMSDSEAQRKIYLDLSLNLFHEYLYGAGKPGTDSYIVPSGWPEERSTAWGHIGEIAILSGNPNVAIEAYKSAIDEAPHFPQSYIDMALAYTALGDYKKAKHWLRVGTQTPIPNTTVITFPRDLKTRALEAAFQIHLNENELELAQKDVEMLLEIMPYEEDLIKRYQTVSSLNMFNKACQSAVFLGKYLEGIGEKEKIQHLIKSFSEDMKKEKFASEMRHKFTPPRQWEDNEVTILCGPGFEEWSPKSITTGLGGSEEAVVYLSRELTKLGWKVTVYANPGKDAGEYDGTTFKQWHDLNPFDEFNVLILWRGIGFTDINPKAKFTMLWLHDIPNNPDFTEERVDKLDKIAVLSDFHRSLLRLHKDGKFEKMPDDKIFITSNGIPDIKIKKWKGNSKRMIYSSSPDRGLIYLLKNWEKIRKEVPEAELHVYYGFQVFDAIHRNNPAMMKWKEDIMNMMKQPGIVYHGRVGHDELHYEMSKSGIWAYPTDFEEISCITAMKAQRLGAVPVVTNYAALKETVRNGLRVDMDITTEEGQEEYVAQLTKLLKDEKEQQEIREPMMEWAKDYFSWENVAKLWSEEFQSHLPSRKEGK